MALSECYLTKAIHCTIIVCVCVCVCLCVYAARARVHIRVFYVKIYVHARWSCMHNFKCM